MAGEEVAEYLSRRGADPERQREIMEMDAAARRETIELYRQENWDGYGGTPEEDAHSQAQNWVTQGGPGKVADVAKDTAENVVQGVANAGFAADQALRDMPVVGPAYGMYADMVNDITSTALPGLTLAGKELQARLEANDSENDKMAQAFFQYTVPFMGYLRGFQAAAGGSAAMSAGQQAAAGVGADVMTSWTAIEPHFERFSQFLHEVEAVGNVPVLNRAVEYFASTDDSDAEERLKNIGDSLMAAGIAGSVVTGAVGAMKVMRPAAQKFGIATAASGLAADSAAQQDDRSRDEKGRFKAKGDE